MSKKAAKEAIKEINEDNVLLALKEINAETTVNAIRKHLGQPVFTQLTPRPVWAADQIRAILTKLAEDGKVQRVGDKTPRVYKIA